jgi:hypothetical protein
MVTAFPRTEVGVDVGEAAEEFAFDDEDEEECDNEEEDVGVLCFGGTAAEDRVVLSDRRGQDGSFAKWLPSHTWHLTGLPLLCNRRVGPPSDGEEPEFGAVELAEDGPETLKRAWDDLHSAVVCEVEWGWWMQDFFCDEDGVVDEEEDEGVEELSGSVLIWLERSISSAISTISFNDLMSYTSVVVDSPCDFRIEDWSLRTERMCSRILPWVELWRPSRKWRITSSLSSS